MRNQCWIMLYSEIPITPDNEMDTTLLSHYLHLQERNCEKSIYLYLAKVTDDIPDYSTLKHSFIPASALTIGYTKAEWKKKDLMESGLRWGELLKTTTP